MCKNERIKSVIESARRSYNFKLQKANNMRTLNEKNEKKINILFIFVLRCINFYVCSATTRHIIFSTKKLFFCERKKIVFAVTMMMLEGNQTVTNRRCIILNMKEEKNNSRIEAPARANQIRKHCYTYGMF